MSISNTAIVALLAGPNIALLLIAIGGLAIYREFCAPGSIAPGVIGGVLVLLGLSSLLALPLHWTGVALVFAAFALLIIEALRPTHNLFSALGAASMAMGCGLLNPQIYWATAVLLALPFSAITGILLKIAVRARRLKAQTGI